MVMKGSKFMEYTGFRTINLERPIAHMWASPPGDERGLYPRHVCAIGGLRWWHV